MAPTRRLEAENKQLRAQLAELEDRFVEQERINLEQARSLEKMVVELTEQKRILEATLKALADGVAVADLEGRLTHLNPTAEALLGTDVTGMEVERWSEVYGVFLPDGVTPFPPQQLPLARALHGESVDRVEMIFRSARNPGGIPAEASSRPIRDEQGRICGSVVIFRDVSERKRWEAQMEAQLQSERERIVMMKRLESAVDELSTPILEIWDDVLALPVIGIVDSRRGAEMMERVLRAVEDRQCRFVIIDITGVDVVDSATADQLLKMVNAIKILGAKCILTGARSAVAQTLVSLGAELGSLLTLRNLKHGLRECLRSLEEEEVRRAPRKPSRALRERGEGA